MSAWFLHHPKETDLALFAGGEAGPFARWRIERHLETCTECERAVSEFFHLTDELRPLAETPEADWAAMERNILAAAAADAPPTEPARGVPAWTWQFGAAAACALVAVAVWKVGPAAKQAEPPALEMAAAEGFVERKADLDRTEAARSIAENRAAEEVRRELSEETHPPASSAPRLALQLGEPEPLLAKKKEGAKNLQSALGDRVNESLPADAAAPASPGAIEEVAEAVVAEAEADAAAPRQMRARLVSEASGARSSAPVDRLGFASGEGASFDDFNAAQPVAFAVLPLPANGRDVRVGADGWISVRTVSADGAMTITDVYDPQ